MCSVSHHPVRATLTAHLSPLFYRGEETPRYALSAESYHSLTYATCYQKHRFIYTVTFKKDILYMLKYTILSKKRTASNLSAEPQ